RPSANLGKFTPMTGRAVRSSARSAGSSSPASHTPLPSGSSWRRAFQTASGTSAGPAGRVMLSGVSPSASVTTLRESSSMRRLRISSGIGHLPLRFALGIHTGLEGLDADAAHGVDEALVLEALVEIGFDDT